MSILPVDDQYITNLGDSLDNLAHKFYSDFRNWRELADINSLDIFEDLTPGSNLRIPTKQEIDNLVNTVQNTIQRVGSINYDQLDLSVLTTSVAATNPHQLIDWIL